MTNSMIVTWIVALGIIIFAQYRHAAIKEVPDGAQNFWEWLVEEPAQLPRRASSATICVKKTFWFFATIFIFILFTNWFGLIPGVGTIGWGTPNAAGRLGAHHPSALPRRECRPEHDAGDVDDLLRLLDRLGVAGQWRRAGSSSTSSGRKVDTKGLMKVLMIVVFALVGVLEVVSILFRPVSLSFRLYGNIFAGENMLESMANIVPGAVVADPGSVLLHGVARRPRAGARLHASHRRLHAAHLLSTRKGITNTNFQHFRRPDRGQPAGASGKHKTKQHNMNIATHPRAKHDRQHSRRSRRPRRSPRRGFHRHEGFGSSRAAIPAPPLRSSCRRS